MNFRREKYIITIAEEENISKAAERLYLSRPALNHYLLETEAQIGTPLFKRINKKMIPTNAGKIFLKGAHQVLAIESQTEKALEDLSNSTIGCLNLGLTRGIGIAAFKVVFPLFHLKYPKFTVNLLEGNVRDLEAAVLKGKIDLALVGRGSIKTELQHITFSPCEVVLVLPQKHPLAKHGTKKGKPHPTINLNKLRNEYFIMMNSDTNIRIIADYHFAKAGFVPKILMECSLSSLSYHMVKNGLGPSILMERQVDKNDDVVCFSLDPKEYWNQSIAFREGTIFTKAEEYFISLIKDYFSENDSSSL
mgnify:CR=1 FL=1